MHASMRLGLLLERLLLCSFLASILCVVLLQLFVILNHNEVGRVLLVLVEQLLSLTAIAGESMGL